MRISELAATTGTPLATVKFYLREGILPPGRRLSRTQAEYGDTHVQRLRLVRALAGTGGLDLATIRRVLAVIDGPEPERLRVLEAAQRALTDPARMADAAPGDGDGPRTESAGATDAAAPPADDGGPPPGQSRVRAWLRARDWRVDPRDPVLADLAAAWTACDVAGIGLTEERLDGYADAAERIARWDLASVPAEPAAAVRQVVLGTVLLEPVLTALRRLAQQHLAVADAAARAPD